MIIAKFTMSNKHDLIKIVNSNNNKDIFIYNTNMHSIQGNDINSKYLHVLIPKWHRHTENKYNNQLFVNIACFCLANNKLMINSLSSGFF